ncbi:MAG: hypothetical protein QOD07_1390 [Frankiaceae bacterium]|jgi:hypothetical protein|nr:hypothetical protein [Frankiaceae bacterium]
MNDVDELLRRDGEQWRATATGLPRVDWAALPGRRRTVASSWWMVAAAGATAAVVVVLAIVLPSLVGGRSARPLPPLTHRPSPSPVRPPLAGPSSFIALNDHGMVTQVDASTGETRGMSATIEGRAATSLTVTDEGNLGYATFSRPRCQVSVVRFRWTSASTAEDTDAGTVAGAKAEAAAVSPDGHLLALAVAPCGKTSGKGSVSVDDLVVVNLDTHQQRRWTGYPDVSFLSSLQWAPDNTTLSYVVNPCCGGGTDAPRLLDTSAPGTSYVKPAPLPVDVSELGSGLVFWYGGRLAVVQGTEIHALSKTGVAGAVLARGLPADVVSVETDTTGRHLLLDTFQHRLFRYDDGTLTPMPGNWVDAGW